MKITFLGTGTSVGVPMIGCRCEVCRSADPRDRRRRTSAFIEAGGRRLLIDCGPDFRSQALDAQIDSVDAVLVTHEHYDHVGGLDDLRPLGNVPVYADDRIIAAMRRSLYYCFGNHAYPGSPRIEPRSVSPGRAIRIGSLEVEPLRVMHGRLPILGYRIGQMAYLTDVKSIPKETMERLHGLDLLVLTALRHQPHPTHMSLREALDTAAAIGARRTYFTHFSHDIGLHETTSAALPDGCMMAYDGLTIEIEHNA